MALHKKPSCCGVKYSLMGSRAENHCRLPQSASRNASWRSVTLGESYTVHQFYAAGFSGPELISDSGNVCCGQTSPHFNLFPGKTDFEFSIPKTKETIHALRSLSDQSGLVWICCWRVWRVFEVMHECFRCILCDLTLMEILCMALHVYIWCD